MCKLLPHDKKVSLLKSNDLCMNCLNAGHFVRPCPSLPWCCKCQRPHHTLLHLESLSSLQSTRPSASPSTSETSSSNQTSTVPSHVAELFYALLMTCRLQIVTPNGLTTQAKGLLDSASSTSFMSEHMAQCLSLHHSCQFAKIVGVDGISPQSVSQSAVNFCITRVVQWKDA